METFKNRIKNEWEIPENLRSSIRVIDKRVFFRLENGGWDFCSINSKMEFNEETGWKITSTTLFLVEFEEDIPVSLKNSISLQETLQKTKIVKKISVLTKEGWVTCPLRSNLKYSDGYWNILPDLGTILKKARKEKGLTQLELSALSGVSKSQISRFERNKITNRISLAALTSCLDLEI